MMTPDEYAAKVSTMTISELLDGVEYGASMSSDDFITSEAEASGYTVANGDKIVALCREEIERRVK